MRQLDTPDHPDLIVGTSAADDAAVWRRPDGRALVSTADFFTPIVDDPRVWGRIAAANAASDVYAMGGTPLFALNLVAWPRDQLPLDVLADVLAGGQEVAAAGGWHVVGGHTVDGPEPMYGQAVTGEVDTDHLLVNAEARAGQRLVLTKPIGTGILATAVKRLDPSAIEPGGRLADTYTQAVAEMTRLNAEAARIALDAAATAATDVTGFGLLGHLAEVLRASGLGAAVDVAAVPRLTGIEELIDDGFVPGGTDRNVEHVRAMVDGDPEPATLKLLADAQTSGGLLFGCPEAEADAALARLADTGHTAAVVGELVDTPVGRIHLR